MKKIFFLFAFCLSSLFPYNPNDHNFILYTDVFKYSAVGAAAFIAGIIAANKLSGSRRNHPPVPPDDVEQSVGSQCEPEPAATTLEEYDKITHNSSSKDRFAIAVSEEVIKQINKRARRHRKAELAQRRQECLEKRRIAQVQAEENSYSIQSEKFSLNEHAFKYAKKLIPDRNLESVSGDAVQINIQKEIVETLNEASLFFSRNYSEHHLKMIFSSADIALEYSDKKNYERAYSFSDLCRGLFDIVSAPVEGVFKGVSNFSDSCISFLDCFLTDPVGMVSNAAKSFFKRLHDCHVEMDKAMFPQNYYPQEDARKVHRGEINTRCLQYFAQIKMFVAEIKNGPREATVNALAHATEFVLSFGLFDVGFLKARNFAKAFSDGIRCETYNILKSQNARAPLIKLVEEASEVARFALEKPLPRSNPSISSVPREKILVKIVKNAKKYPNSVRLPKNHFAETIKKLMQFEEIFVNKEVSRLLRKLINQSRPTSAETVTFQRDTSLGDGYILRFRRDIGYHAHSLPNSGYPYPVDHYNVELIRLEPPRRGTRPKVRKIFNKHILVDKDLSVTDFLE